MKTIFEQQGVEYRQTGDYMFPNVELTEQTEYQIGVWGQRYKRYIKSNHRVLYYNYLTSGKLSLNATSLNSGSLSWLRNASAIALCVVLESDASDSFFTEPVTRMFLILL